MLEKEHSVFMGYEYFIYILLSSNILEFLKSPERNQPNWLIASIWTLQA